MIEGKYITIPELAKVLGISRIAVYKKVKRGEIKATKIGRVFVISKDYVSEIWGEKIQEEKEREIDRAVKKTVAEYGETLKLLGNE